MPAPITVTLSVLAALWACCGDAMAQRISPVAPVVSGSKSGFPIEYVGAGDALAGVGSNSFVIVRIDEQNQTRQAGQDTSVEVRLRQAQGSGGAKFRFQDQGSSPTNGSYQEVIGDGDNDIETGEVWAFNIERQIRMASSTFNLVTIALFEDRNDDLAPDPGGTTAAFETGFHEDALTTNERNEAYEIVRTPTTMTRATVSGFPSASTGRVDVFVDLPFVGLDPNEQAQLTLFDDDFRNINATMAGSGSELDFEFVNPQGDNPTQFNSGVFPAGSRDIVAGSIESLNGGGVLRFRFDPTGTRLVSMPLTIAVDPVTGQVRDSSGTIVSGFVTTQLRNCPGDVDGEGLTTVADIALVVSNLGAGSPGAAGTRGDADGDGLTTTADIALVVSNLGTDCTR